MKTIAHAYFDEFVLNGNYYKDRRDTEALKKHVQHIFKYAKSQDLKKKKPDGRYELIDLENPVILNNQIRLVTKYTKKRSNPPTKTKFTGEQVERMAVALNRIRKARIVNRQANTDRYNKLV